MSELLVITMKENNITRRNWFGTILLFGVLIGTVVFLKYLKKPVESSESFEFINIPLTNHIDSIITNLEEQGPNGPNGLATLLTNFNNWLKKNPQQMRAFNEQPTEFGNVVIDTYFRQSDNLESPYKYIKNHANAEKLKLILNKLISGDISKESFGHSLRPAYLDQFSQWLDDDYPRRVRFDIAMKGANNTPSKITITSIVNEFVSTNQVPLTEAQNLRAQVLSYLELSDTLPAGAQTYNTTDLERLRYIYKNIPDSPALTKLLHYQRIYKDGPLGAQIRDFGNWLFTLGPEWIIKMDAALDTRTSTPEDAGLVMEELINMYPGTTPVLRKAITQQFVLNVFSTK